MACRKGDHALEDSRDARASRRRSFKGCPKRAQVELSSAPRRRQRPTLETPPSSHLPPAYLSCGTCSPSRLSYLSATITVARRVEHPPHLPSSTYIFGDIIPWLPVLLPSSAMSQRLPSRTTSLVPQPLYPSRHHLVPSWSMHLTRRTSIRRTDPESSLNKPLARSARPP